MIKIRLTKTGKKNSPSYRIVVANRRSKRDGESLAILGYYNPRTSPKTIEYDKVEAKAWMDKGAIPTDTVRALFERTNLLPKTKGTKKKFQAPPGKKAKARVVINAEKAKAEAK
jgi:small subunit ribosomal protein S16